MDHLEELDMLDSKPKEEHADQLSSSRTRIKDTAISMKDRWINLLFFFVSIEAMRGNEINLLMTDLVLVSDGQPNDDVQLPED